LFEKKVNCRKKIAELTKSRIMGETRGESKVQIRRRVRRRENRCAIVDSHLQTRYSNNYEKIAYICYIRLKTSWRSHTLFYGNFSRVTILERYKMFRKKIGKTCRKFSIFRIFDTMCKIFTLGISARHSYF